MTDNLTHHLALYSNLDCRVATRFARRPTLLEAVAHMLREQWQAYGLNAEHDPASLSLCSRQPPQGRIWIRPLTQAVVERYCQADALHLTEGDDYLTHDAHADPASALDIDLLQVQRLINQVAPFLIDAYRQQLLAYWSQPDDTGETPWAWYAGYLKQLLGDALEGHRSAASLPHLALATARLVHDYPGAAQRSAFANTATLSVSELSVDYAADGKLDVDLASAILIERPGAGPGQPITLLYTLAGRLLGFTSRQELLDDIGLTWPADSRASPRLVSLAASSGQVFEHQALGMLTQQLRVIEQLAWPRHPSLSPLALNLGLDHMSAMLDQCNVGEAAQRQALSARLPSWLRSADGRLLRHYSNLLVDIAQAYKDVHGQFWLDGIDSAEVFANQRLAARFEHDHPGFAIKPEHIRVINQQTTSAVLAGQDGLIQSGEVTPVTYTLAQLAIGNLGLLKPGGVTLAGDDQAPLPAWFDERYLRSVISELDIGSAYPDMLRGKLLGDPQQRQQRLQLLGRQLRSQLPSQALALHLQGKEMDQDAAERIAQALSPQWTAHVPRWVMRPLGFIKSPGAAPDHPLNTWLIEAETPAHFPCLLYRPLHRESLLQFPDRLALFVAISTPGALQTDLLQRLPPEDRRFYDHGGFLEPHLFTPLDYAFTVPLSTPAPVQLAVESAIAAPVEAIYQACVEEAIKRFKSHSATSEQTRHQRWKDLAWLTLNAVLPFAGKAVNQIAWLFQMETALAQYIEPTDTSNPTEDRLALVNLLVNVAMLLFSHSLPKLSDEEQAAHLPSTAPLPQRPASEPATLPPSVALPTESPLDFSWSCAGLKLDGAQRQALTALRATLSSSALASAAPSGPLRGLHLHQDLLYAVVKGQVYEVALQAETQQPRIVGPDGTLGPWLQLDAQGAWQLDLGLRLRAGMPLGKRIQQAKAEKRQEFDALTARISAATARSNQQADNLADDLQAMLTDAPEALRAALDSMQVQVDFWEQFLSDFERLDTLGGGLKNFKVERARLLYQAGMARQSMQSGLRRLYKSQRQTLLVLARKEHNGEALSAADERIVKQRLETIAPLLDKLIENSEILGRHQSQLQQLSSLSHPDIAGWHEAATRIKVTPPLPVALHFMRLELLINRMEFMHPLQAADAYWLERFWKDTQLLVSQRLNYLALQDASDEARVRLLQGQGEQLASLRRQLQNIARAQLDATTKLTLDSIESDLGFFEQGINSDLGNLPSYPPTVSVAQLRSQLPGLIETADHGLLLGEPRQNDASIIDINGPDSHVPSRAYHQVDGGWQQLQEPPQAKPAPAPSTRSLKRLLQEGTRALRSSRERSALLEQQINGSYLPVEIEEQLNQLHQDLLAQINAIEARLTADNQTDEAAPSQDAAQTVRSLYQQAERLRIAAPRLRIQASLAQLPRMGDVQYLIENGQVQVRAAGARTRTARVKGRPADFLDEYVLTHEGRPLWYAHFHYPAMDSPRSAFIVGHLKTAAQRFLTHAEAGKVHRGAITAQAAQRYFFNVP